MMWRRPVLLPPLLLLLLSLTLVAVVTSAAKKKDDDDDFDLLIFAQSWPVTTCIEWKERGKGNTCNIRESCLPSYTLTFHFNFPYLA